MSKAKVFEMTNAGIKKLEAELEERKYIKRDDIAERIKVARAQGDIAENSEYDDAKDAQRDNEARILEIENILKNAKVIEDDEISETEVNIGALVVLSFTEGKKQTKVEYTLVSPEESDFFTNKISTDSPLGIAIRGRKKGDNIDVVAPGGTIRYKIEEIKKP